MTVTDRDVIGAILAAERAPGADECRKHGDFVGHMYTDKGFPIDMALGQFEKNMPGLTQQHKILILHYALGWLVQHKRNSGATDKAIERQRRANRETMRAFMEKGETGLY